jgi:hypothetical protein
MIACRPQEIWLTFDFDPLCNIAADEPNFGGYDYSMHINAYIKMYNLFRKYGITPIHYAEKHLAPASLHGKELLRMVKERLRDEYIIEDTLDLRLANATSFTEKSLSEYANRIFYIDADMLRCGDIAIPIAQKSFNIGIAPASHHVESTISELSNKFNVNYILDKDVVYKDKEINNISIIDYKDIRVNELDYIYIKTTDEILNDIIFSIFSFNSNIQVIIDKKYIPLLLSKPSKSRVIDIHPI